MGASMVKWTTKKMLWYTKTILFLVKGIIVAKHCLNWISFHDDLCYYVQYLNVENQVEISST